MLIAPRLRPPLARITRRLYGLSLEEVASEVRILHQATPRKLAPPISLPDQFKRAQGFNSDTDLSVQERWLLADEDKNGPTKAYRLSDVMLAPAGVFHSKSFLSLRPSASRRVIRGIISEQPDGLLCTSEMIEAYFGHWIDDGLPLEKLAESLELPAVVIDKKLWMHTAEYRQLAGIDEPDECKSTFFRSLWIVDDRGLNGGRIDRMRQVRNSVLSNTRPSGLERVFLRRGSSGSKRILLNEEEIVATLMREGFDVIEPELLSASSIAAALAAARIVVTVEGSHATHTHVSMPESSSLIVIQPPQHFNALARVFASALGHQYAFTVADPHVDGFVQSVEDLLTTIDLVEAVSKPKNW